MISIINKEDCVGCNGCVQICPQQCIEMFDDVQGFVYPNVNLSECINCGLCEKVCPVINQSPARSPEQVFSAKNRTKEIQDASSSGGVFFALADAIISEGGVVFGARFDENWSVVHDFAETVDGVVPFMTSKYVQSRIGQSYIKARDFLNKGRKVLFTGTPCQIAGLKRFLRKDYGDLLLTLDVVCHGVPSPGVWNKYLEDLLRRLGAKKNSDFQSTLNSEMPVITGINFRNKKLGWQKFGFSVHAVARQGDKNTDFQSTKHIAREIFFEPHYENLYMKGFLNDLYLRPSCYACPAKCGKSYSDITLADFWGIDKRYPDLYCDGCNSLILSGSSTGTDLLSKIGIESHIVSYSDALAGNPAIERSASRPKQYSKFWEAYTREGLSAISTTVSYMRPSLLKRIINKLKSLIRRVLNH